MVSATDGLLLQLPSGVAGKVVAQCATTDERRSLRAACRSLRVLVDSTTIKLEVDAAYLEFLDAGLRFTMLQVCLARGPTGPLISC